MENIYLLFFYLFAALTIGAALFIVFTRNVIYSAFALLVCLLGVAAIYVFLNAEFLAVVQLVIYIGGVLLLLLFGIMLTNRLAGESFLFSGSKNLVLGISSGLALFILFSVIIYYTDFQFNIEWIKSAEAPKASSLKQLGIKITGSHVLPFEVSALILLVALMGAAYIAGVMIKRKGEQQ